MNVPKVPNVGCGLVWWQELASTLSLSLCPLRVKVSGVRLAMGDWQLVNQHGVLKGTFALGLSSFTCEGFILRMCLDLSAGTSGEEFQNLLQCQLRESLTNTWIYKL